MDKPNENMSDHLCNQRTTADTSHGTLHLTVENVMRLEQEQASAEGFLPERSVEDYMRRTHQLSLEEGQKSSDITEATPLAKAPSDIPTQSMEEHEADSQIKDMNNTVNEVSGDENKRETQASNTSTPSNDSIAKKIRIERPATSEVFITGHTLDGREFVAISDQTQTEWSDLETSSKNSSTIVFFTTENLIAEKSVSSHSEYEVERGESEIRYLTHPVLPTPPLKDEEEILTEVDNHTETLCEFCTKTKKGFPSVTQLASQPVDTLFCCVKCQEIFQYLIFEIMEYYSTGNTEEMISIQPHSEIDEELRALQRLREEIQNKGNMEEFIASVANHLSMCGSLFMMETIHFTLLSEDSDTTNRAQKDEFEDLFISIPMLDSEHVKRRHEAASKRYYTGQSFLLLFPDGTGQVLYPSGTMGILFACSKPVQITFIILEDVKRKPQIRAVFMSNGHAACYHLNGMLWVVLDPWGGSYFDDNGILQKHWKWWDWSPHVHAPPFQSITLKLNANIEVKFLTQDQIHVTFSRKEENVTFNVGSNLMLKDPEKSTLLKPKIGEREFYLCSKKFQIYNLLKNISKLVRMPNGHQSRTEKIEDCVIQLQESLNNIRRHTSKEIDPGIFQAYSAEVLPCEASLSIKIVPKKKHRFTHDHQQDEPHTNRNRSANTETDQKDTDKVKKKKTKKKRTSNQVT
ncbi:glutamate-rich protein 6B [Ascaphus truei]|uniref:glutamate-rich protein 6B n=1 Tax=Ascaphus truei TaxID=8439 RepID=UPI003F5A1BF4